MLPQFYLFLILYLCYLNSMYNFSLPEFCLPYSAFCNYVASIPRPNCLPEYCLLSLFFLNSMSNFSLPEFCFSYSTFRNYVPTTPCTICLPNSVFDILLSVIMLPQFHVQLVYLSSLLFQPRFHIGRRENVT